MTLAAEFVGWATGEMSPNHTATRWQVSGTDLGVAWDDGHGGVLLAFGDSFHPLTPQGGGAGGDWRSNLIARTTSRNLDRGVALDWFAEDRDGHAREVLPSLKVNHVEMTVIPTGGCAVGARQLMAYMSVKSWGAPGRWTTNHAGLAYSEDGGRTWAVPREARWHNTAAGDQRFQVCALVAHEGHILIYGTPHGRAGHAYLARAPRDNPLDLGRHEQWDGRQWLSGDPDRDQWRTRPVIRGPVSELSVAYHEHSGQWLAAYYRENTDAVAVHTAPRPTGPWSRPRTVVTAKDYPGLYGAFWHPWSMADPEPVFLMSQWVPYNTMAMRLTGLG